MTIPRQVDTTRGTSEQTVELPLSDKKNQLVSSRRLSLLLGRADQHLIDGDVPRPSDDAGSAGADSSLRLDGVRLSESTRAAC
jgi:hypothetical protein